MIVLGVESSCDETGLALYDTSAGLLSHALYSQVAMHEQYGGVVPELASRDHIRRAIPLLEQVLGEHVPPAPPNVPALEKQDQHTVANLTLRQRTELHRTNAVCANCHKILDPIGFGLENYDLLGRYRTHDEGRTDCAISGAGEVPSVGTFNGPAALGEVP